MPHFEQATMNILKSENIKFETQKKFVWLKTDKSKMSLDFYLPDYNIAIECQGIQHYNAIGMFTEEKAFKIKQRDKLKNELCTQHGIGVRYIKYDDDIKENLCNLIKELNARFANEINYFP